MKNFRNVLLLLPILTFCCKKPYNPPAISSPNTYLVVEGTINSGSDSTVIKLSRTVKLDSANTINPVIGATVTVENDQNQTWPLIDAASLGLYTHQTLNLAVGSKYRLRINTQDGKQYLSDYIAVLPTPPIDSIGYTIKDTVMHLYVNTHDPANNTHYYRWEYAETWQFHSNWPSAYVYDPVSKSIVPRTSDQQVHFCFGNNQSSNILITSTAKLSQDLVYQSPLINIPLSSEKIGTKYSILVKQYALPYAGYQFYLNILNNTENLGSIFDAQPSQVKGNIHCLSNPNEPVIGYLTVTNVQSKRIFLTADQLNSAQYTRYPYNCELDSAVLKNSQGINTINIELLELPITNVPVSAIGSDLPPLGYLYSSTSCVDCTVRGTTITPPFWK